MPLRPSPPTVPLEIIEKYGPPEAVFGPNLRFRVVGSILGVILGVMGVVFLVMANGVGGPPLPMSEWVSGKLALPLFLLGTTVVGGSFLIPLTWTFVCPGGVVRARKDEWTGLAWNEIARFEDAGLVHQGVSVKQCRLVLKAGGEWGFLADHVADYNRLAMLLRAKMEALKNGGNSPGR